MHSIVEAQCFNWPDVPLPQIIAPIPQKKQSILWKSNTFRLIFAFFFVWRIALSKVCVKYWIIWLQMHTTFQYFWKPFYRGIFANLLSIFCDRPLSLASTDRAEYRDQITIRSLYSARSDRRLELRLSMINVLRCFDTLSFGYSYYKKICDRSFYYSAQKKKRSPPTPWAIAYHLSIIYYHISIQMSS